MLIKDIITEQQIVQEISRPHWAKVVQFLTSRGYDKLGSGLYAHVMGKGASPHVLKLFSSTDQGYLSYVAMAMTYPNKHFPKFKGKLMKITNDYYAVRMEMLYPIDNQTLAKEYGFNEIYDFLEVLKELIRAGQNQDYPLSEFPEHFYKTAYYDYEEGQIERFMTIHKELAEACFRIGLYAKGHVDLHWGNIMEREDGTLVITDPLAG
jgi:hypothetical protein